MGWIVGWIPQFMVMESWGSNREVMGKGYFKQYWILGLPNLRQPRTADG